MTHPSREIRRVLAIDPTSRGFGFAVLEGPENLIDYGTRGCPTTAPEVCLKRVEELLDIFHLDLVVLEDTDHEDSKRTPRIRKLLDDMELLVASRGVKTRRVPTGRIKKHFGARNKYQVAVKVAGQFAQLAPRLPAPLKSWDKEPERMAIFTAVARGLAVFQHGGPSVV